MQRGAKLSGSGGLPDETTLKIGLKHLKDYYMKKRDVIMPVGNYTCNQNVDNSSYTMLNYYRNPINHIFFNESLIVCSLFSFGIDTVWKQGIVIEELFLRTCFLA